MVGVLKGSTAEIFRREQATPGLRCRWLLMGTRRLESTSTAVLGSRWCVVMDVGGEQGVRVGLSLAGITSACACSGKVSNVHQN